MRPRNYLLLLFAIMLSLNLVASEYWFQFGARGDVKSLQNNGAGVYIQTVKPQQVQDGSVAYWVGEDLNNGAFLQIGYLIENQSGSYPSQCNQSGCSDYQNLNAGDAEWFYEYFPSDSVDSFLGAIGADGSAGVNGTFNNYSFYSRGDTWYFSFDGNVVGDVNLGTGSSGDNVPIAFGEVANTTTSKQVLRPVAFKNLGFYSNGAFLLVPQGYSYIGYGVGSDMGLKNMYGVSESSEKVNNFLVGSGLPQPPNDTELWTLGYLLSIVSKYGNLVNATEYVAYSTVNISEPNILYITPSSRGVFLQWSGSGYGSYTGTSNRTTIFLGANITENAVWQPQYLLDISSAYANTTGGGWYNANTTAHYSISANSFYTNPISRLLTPYWYTSRRT